VLALAAALSTPTGAWAAAPTYLRTIGGPGRADIYPGGIDVDAAGHVYIADTGNDQVERFAPGANSIDWRVGVRGSTSQQGSFAEPRDVAVTSGGELYVADTGHGIVQVLDAVTGAYLRRLSYGGFRVPIGVSVGTDGRGTELVLVSDGRTGNVEIFDTAGGHLRTIPPRLGSTSGTRDAATSANGTIFVADYRHDMIQVYDRSGTWLRSWGGSTASTCQQIPRPYGVDVDDAGVVYVATSNRNLVRAFGPLGGCVATYGVSGTGERQLSQLRRVAVSEGPDPVVFAADLWGIKVLEYRAADASFIRRLGSWPKPAAGGFNEVRKVAVTATAVFGVDTNNHRWQRFDLDGANPTAFGTKGVSRSLANFNWPFGIAVNPADGHVWVADTHNSNLREFLPDGTFVRTFGKLGSATGSFNWPTALTFDRNGNMYVADTSNNRIQSFTPTLAFRWAYGSGGTGLSNLKRPSGITVDPVGGRILVADTANSRIVSLDRATGARLEILPIARGTSPGQIVAPEDVAVDAAGHVWIADTLNHRVERFEADGSYSGIVLGGPGLGAGMYGFARPCGLAFGPDGLLYVADTYNDRIQVYQP
jgi:DNA-binding beta-propeller fold protein YncE